MALATDESVNPDLQAIALMVVDEVTLIALE
jgi:hypothetical protein